MGSVLWTFDDGPGPSTPALLDVLAAAGVRATFFVLGSNLEKRREIAVRAAREGHELGNHTVTHARPDAIDAPTFATEVAHTDALIAEVMREAGRAGSVPRVRLPYGIVGDDPRIGFLTDLGREHVGWTADFEDWLDPDPTELAARILAHIGQVPYAVLDLHDSSRLGARRDQTVEAVRLVLAS